MPFYPLPRLEGGGNQGFADAISADGHTVTGWVSATSDDSFQIACYWTSASGYWTDIVGPTTITNPNPAVGDFAEAFGVSSDGSIIVGVVQIPSPAGGSPFKWTSGGGLVPFDTVTGQARAISADGTIIVGYVQLAGAGTDQQACYWDAATLTRTNLGFLPGHDNSLALAISSDGTAIVGWSQLGMTDVTNSLRAFRWTVGDGMVDLGLPTDAVTSLGYGVSGDGAQVVGAFATSGAGGAFQWTDGDGMVILAMSVAAAVSGDNLTIFGQGTDFPYHIGYLKSGAVIVPFPVALDPAYPTTIQTTTASGISANGLTMVGTGNPSFDPFFVPFVYRAASRPQVSIIGKTRPPV